MVGPTMDRKYFEVMSVESAAYAASCDVTRRPRTLGEHPTRKDSRQHWRFSVVRAEIGRYRGGLYESLLRPRV